LIDFACVQEILRCIIIVSLVTTLFCLDSMQFLFPVYISDKGRDIYPKNLKQWLKHFKTPSGSFY